MSPLQPFGVKACILGGLVAIILAGRSIKKKSLTKMGGLAALFVGFTSVATGYRGFNLLIFYQVATIATKFQHDLKCQKDGTIQVSSVRGPMQVFCCSILAVLLSIIHAIYCGPERNIEFTKENLIDMNWMTTSNVDNNNLSSYLTCAILAHHATCLADTLASELGILYSNNDNVFLLIAPWKPVPPGTNGGITIMGTIFSGVGGFIIGLATILIDAFLNNHQSTHINNTIIPILIYCTFCGLIGSMIDSLLGATLQETYYNQDTKLVYHADNNKVVRRGKKILGWNILNNEQVNFWSIAITMIVGSLFVAPLIFGYNTNNV